MVGQLTVGQAQRHRRAISKTPAALCSSLRRRDSSRIRSDDGAPGSAAPPSLTDTTWTSTPDAAELGGHRAHPERLVVGVRRDNDQAGHSDKSSFGSVLGIDHSRADVPPSDSGIAANRASYSFAPRPRNPPNAAVRVAAGQSSAIPCDCPVIELIEVVGESAWSAGPDARRRGDRTIGVPMNPVAGGLEPLDQIDILSEASARKPPTRQ